FSMVRGGGSGSILEYELQSELDLPGTCCGRRQNTGTRRELPGQIKDLPGSRAGRLKVGVIGYVETLCAELQVFLLGDRETLHDREIHTGETRSDQRIPAQVDEGSERLRDESARVEIQAWRADGSARGNTRAAARFTGR